MSLKFEPVNEKQKMLVGALESPDIDIVGVFGPSGTGKSFVVILHGISKLREEKYKRMIIIRPLVSISRSKLLDSSTLGEMYYETASSYLLDVAGDYIDLPELKNFLDSRKIVFVDPEFLTGRTFDNSLIFLDDVQYLNPEIIPEAIIRVGRNSKLVIAGDPVLQALEGKTRNTAAIARELLLGEERSLVINMGVNDIVRPGSKRGFKLALESRLRRRSLSEEENKVKAVLQSHAPDADIVTVVWLKDLKEKYSSQSAPDVLAIAKENTLSRLIGKKGERINKAQEEAGVHIRAIELTNDLGEIVKAIHPVGWIRKHIESVEIEGAELVVYVDPEEYGAFVGKQGTYIRFLDEALKRILGLGVRGRHAEKPEDKRKKDK
ncbi:MAG: PhoH family protein [Thermofilum sp.]|uniref:PhoH family protein n=1 Tax=Thermofilum sp. TaxID=1961369 RepID=UPI002587FDBD|nr:PhoH family protein [Thermofilum sp.]MCI4408846.1 PhoH family protein [Thermofilum sp.]